MLETAAPASPEESQTSGAWLGVTLLSALLIVPLNELFRPHHTTKPTLAAIAINILLLSSFEWMIVAVSNRPWFAVGLATVVLETLALCNYWKLRYLGMPIHPADIFVVGNLRHTNFFSAVELALLVFACLVVGAGLIGVFRMEKLRASLTQRLFCGAMAATIASIVVLAPRSPIAVDYLLAREIYVQSASAAAASEANGLLLDPLLHVNDMFVSSPRGYDAEAVRREVTTLSANAGTPEGTSVETLKPVNLIILVIEAMMDPADLGLRFTENPMPYFSDLRTRFSSGWVYSPEAGGRSANPEFELLSGMALYFLPPESVPYISYVSRPLPALPRVLSERGYLCRALHVDTLEFYNYFQVYHQLGFRSAQTLRWTPGIPMDAAGRVPSDEALIDSIVAASRGSKPYFLFAFTNGTHLPYDYPAYLDSTLDVVDPLPPSSHAEVKTYINALRAADRAIAKLIETFGKTSDRTVIAILGDHLPGLSPESYRRSRMIAAHDLLDGTVFSHRTPAVLWSNLGSPKLDFELSLNFFAQRILRELHSPLPSIWKANAAMADRYPVISKFVQRSDGRRYLPNDVPPEDADAIRRYGLIQYDQMFGDRYASSSAVSGRE